MIDYTRGYTAMWRVVRVDPRTWMDGGVLGGVLGGSASVSRDCTDAVPLLESGTLDLVLDDGAEFVPGYHRLEMLAVQDGAGERVKVATLLYEEGDSSYGRGGRTVRAEGRSVLHPASQRRFADGAYCPAGADGAEYAASLLRGSIAAPVEVHGSFTLGDPIVHALGATHLEGVWDVLNAAGWVMQIAGDGTVHLLPRPASPALELSGAGAGMLSPSVEVAEPEPPCNVYTAIDGGESETAEDAEAIAAAGRRIEEVDASPRRVGGETLSAYARRMLAERAAAAQREYSYTRAWAPDCPPWTVARATLPRQGLEGDFVEVAQELECGRGISVEVRARRLA